MIICYDNQIINLYMGWRTIHLDTITGDAFCPVNTKAYTITIELNDKTCYTFGIFAENEYYLAKMMMDKIKEGLSNNIHFFDFDDYLKIWKRKLEQEKERETKNG